MDNQVISPSTSLRKSIPTLNVVITWTILIFLVWAFFSKQTLRFYASFLFLFYQLTNSMWISVILLGVFQTILLIPFRIINLTRSKHIKDFEAKVGEIKRSSEQTFLIKKTAKTGNRALNYYLIDFLVHFVSYVSIGRLFLTDFYSIKLSPNLLYSFVPYPDYPLQDLWFKIPYLNVTQTQDLGFGWVMIVWVIILLLSMGISFAIKVAQKQNNPVTQLRSIAGFIAGSSLTLMVISYILIRNFPTEVLPAIFSGDVSKPNPAFNTITALATFFTILWLDIPTIFKKVELAKTAEIDPIIIRKTQNQLFGESLRSATVVGLGAYFITNLIPCAFELSIFTLEIISWLSPFTLDKLILRGATKYEAPVKFEAVSNETI